MKEFGPRGASLAPPLDPPLNSFILELFLIPIATVNSCYWKGFVCEILSDLCGWQFFFKNHSKCLYQSDKPPCHFLLENVPYKQQKKSIFNIVMLLYHLTDIDLKHTAIKLFTGCLSCCSFLPFWNYWPCLVAECHNDPYACFTTCIGFMFLAGV